jgi:hypothetical protein
MFILIAHCSSSSTSRYIGCMLVLIASLATSTVRASTWRCVDSTGHAYTSSQSVPSDTCAMVNADNPYATAPDNLDGSSEGAPAARRAKPTQKRTSVAKPRRSGASIGMSKEEALASSWGRPESVNRTTNAYGTREQWVYGGGNYLYFENGVLTSIQN